MTMMSTTPHDVGSYGSGKEGPLYAHIMAEKVDQSAAPRPIATNDIA
jgi:hypothetical protein